MPSRFDKLLGKGVITATPDGRLRVDDNALATARHQPKPERGQRCWCPACQLVRKAELDAYLAARAPAAVAQPWDPKVPRRAA